MEINTQISGNMIYFSRWCRKGYAIFAALGRQVQIAGLAMHICLCAMLKSARKGLIVNKAAVWEGGAEIELDTNWLEKLIFCFHKGDLCPDQNELLKIINERVCL